MFELIPVGELGKEYRKYCRMLTKRVGGNWFWVFLVGKRLYSFDLGMQMYEDAYWSFFRNDISKLKHLATNYHDVCVTDAKDLESGMDFRKQTQEWEHFADIAIRRAIVRLGVGFKGKEELFKIAGTEYNDGHIHFHLPHLIHRSDGRQSARAWIKSNRMVVIAKTLEDRRKLNNILVK